MREMLVGLPDVQVIAVVDRPGDSIMVYVEARLEQVRCAEGGT